tara:strand:+ start:161 stop:376 length:216 start_codon:yes stop_codon:yes gene_type:complete
MGKSKEITFNQVCEFDLQTFIELADEYYEGFVAEKDLLLQARILVKTLELTIEEKVEREPHDQFRGETHGY